MVLELYEPTVEDSRSLTDLLFDGYYDDPVSAMMYSLPAPESTLSAMSKTLSDGWGKNLDEHWMCVRDSETGDLLSSVQWFFVPERMGEEWKKFPGATWPDDWDHEFCMSVMGTSWQKKVEIMGTKPYIRK